MDQPTLLRQIERAADELVIVRIMVELDQLPLAHQRILHLRAQLDLLLPLLAPHD